MKPKDDEAFELRILDAIANRAFADYATIDPHKLAAKCASLIRERDQNIAFLEREVERYCPRESQ